MPTFETIAAKLRENLRISTGEALFLFASNDLLTIGELAALANERKNEKKVFFNVNRHINPTNICVNRCAFCAFYRTSDDDGAYSLTMEEICQRAVETEASGATEVHIVGGLHPDLAFGFYEEMLSALALAAPGIHIKAFTAVEIDYFASISGLSVEQVLKRLMAAGLGSMPGGGAEIFSDRTRMAAWDKKTKSDVWLRIHGEAHSLGIATNCTMLYGHIETIEERVDHMVRLREQQDASGGFLAFIPLAFHPANTEMADLPATTGFDDIKTLAIGRLMLDNIPHVKAFWIMLGLKVAQLSTAFGVDDLDGTVVEERITHMAGATTPEALSKDDLVAMIRETGHVPVERDTLYKIVKVYEGEAC